MCDFGSPGLSVVSPPPLLFRLAWDRDRAWTGVGVDHCGSRRLLLTFSEPEGGCFRGLAGPPVLPQPGPPALSLQPELFVGKPGGTPYFWECRSTGGPGFPGLHGPVAGQYGPGRRGGGWAEETRRRDKWCVRCAPSNHNKLVFSSHLLLWSFPVSCLSLPAATVTATAQILWSFGEPQALSSWLPCKLLD